MSEIDRYLDGDLPSDDMAEADRAEARSWDRMLEAFRAASPAQAAPHWLESRVMAEIEALPEPGRFARAWQWATRPRQVTVRPGMAGLAAAAVVAALFLLPIDRTGGLADGSPGVPAPGTASLVYVEFTLQAPEARSVSVGGDFDAWAGAHSLEDPDGDGVWSGRIPIEPGVHEYMFLVDDEQWVTDPRATRYHDDGFGNRNAVLAVALPSA